MSVTYTWAIDKVGTKDQVNNSNEVLSDAIVYVQFRKIGTDNLDNTASYVGEVKLSAESTTLADFVGYDSVDSATVISWIESELSADAMTKIDNVIDKKIASMAITIRDFNN